MATPYIMPLGFIDRTTDDAIIFLLTNPEDSLGIRLGTPITVWRYSQEHLALAKLRGTITAARSSPPIQQRTSLSCTCLAPYVQRLRTPLPLVAQRPIE